MKNSILIDVDTDRNDRPILFGKPPDIAAPETQEETREMILNDIACVAEALTTLILMASSNNYGNKEELVVASVKTIQSILDTKDNSPDSNVQY